MTLFQKDQVRRLRSEGMGYLKISACLGVSKNTIKSYCKRNNIRRVVAVPETKQENKEKEILVFCRNCGRSIIQRLGMKPRKFCSGECRTTWWNRNLNQVSKKSIYYLECAGCGKPFESYGTKNSKYCTHNCYIKDRFAKRGY